VKKIVIMTFMFTWRDWYILELRQTLSEV